MEINTDALFDDILKKIEELDLYEYNIINNLYDIERDGTKLVFIQKENPTISCEKKMPRITLFINPKNVQMDDNFNIRYGTEELPANVFNIPTIEMISVMLQCGDNMHVLYYTNEGVFEKYVKFNSSEG